MSLVDGLKDVLAESMGAPDSTVDSVFVAVYDYLADTLGETQEKLLAEKNAFKTRMQALERQNEALREQILKLSPRLVETGVDESDTE